MNVVAITLLAFAILAVAVICVERFEWSGRGGKTVNCPGVVTNISEHSENSGRSLFKWDVQVSFEYEGMSYSIALHYPSKPNVELGKTVNVEVNTKDPRNSNCNLTEYTEGQEN